MRRPRTLRRSRGPSPPPACAGIAFAGARETGCWDSARNRQVAASRWSGDSSRCGWRARAVWFADDRAASDVDRHRQVADDLLDCREPLCASFSPKYAETCPLCRTAPWPRPWRPRGSGRAATRPRGVRRSGPGSTVISGLAVRVHLVDRRREHQVGSLTFGDREVRLLVARIGLEGRRASPNWIGFTNIQMMVRSCSSRNAASTSGDLRGTHRSSGRPDRAPDGRVRSHAARIAAIVLMTSSG